VPTKGLSLPLVSAGGSGLVITCAALGLLYSVTRFLPDAAATPEEETEATEIEAKPVPLRRTPHRVTQAIWAKFTV
jgi:cell division protein FtsW